MARSRGVLWTSIWEPTSDFRSLSPMAQWAYKMLVSQPEISNLGILPFRPEKWARLARGLSVEVVEDALDELADARFVVIDRPAFELLIRTFVKHDGVWTQWQLVKNAQTLIRQVESDDIRELLEQAHPWLVSGVDPKLVKEQFAGWYETPHTSSERTVDRPLERTDERPVERPPVKGVGVGVGDSSRSNPEPEFKIPRQPAAAEEEPPRESRVRAVVSGLRDSDHDSLDRVLPLAQQLPSELFEDVVFRNKARISSGEVGNHTGSLIAFLRRACRELRVRQETSLEQIDVRTLLERDARSYARGGHPWEVAEPLVRRFLAKRSIIQPAADELVTFAAGVYEASIAEREPLAA